MTFSSGSWAHRFAQMGDASEKKFVESVDGKCERWGFNRPEGVHIPSLPARVRGAPDFVTNKRLVECMGLGRKQRLQVKLEKWGVMRWWDDLHPLAVWVWDSHKRRSCLISLTALDRLIQTPDEAELSYFDGNKLVLSLPADDVFDRADLTLADL